MKEIDISSNRFNYFRQRGTLTKEKKSWLGKIAILLGVFVLAGGTWQLLGQNITKGSHAYVQKSQDGFKENFRLYLIKNNKNSRQLLLLGQKLAPNNLDLATMAFEEASLRNKNYRDAFVNLGLAYLKQAQLEKNKEVSHQKMLLSKTALERAVEIDPIYPYSYQLEQIVYKELGEKENFDLAKSHYEAVNVVVSTK